MRSSPGSTDKEQERKKSFHCISKSKSAVSNQIPLAYFVDMVAHLGLEKAHFLAVEKETSKSVCTWMCVLERVREKERETETERVCERDEERVFVCVFVNVCVWERKGESETWRESVLESECLFVCL